MSSSYYYFSLLVVIYYCSLLPSCFLGKTFPNELSNFLLLKNETAMIRKKKINSPQKNKINQQELLNYWSCFFKKWKQKNKHNKHIFFSHNIISDLFERRNSNTNSPPSSNTHLEYNETENYKKDETTKDKKNSNRTNEKLFLPALPHILNLPDNNSSDHSPHNIHYQRTPNTQKTISFPEKLIFAHPEKFGIVQEDKNDPNYTHVYLYRHKIALTPNELTQMEKNFMNYNKPKVYQLHNHVNTKKKKCYVVLFAHANIRY